MAPGKGSADWATYPEDLTHLLDFLYEQRSRISDGGNWDRTVINDAAAHMASNWPPKKGGPKTANSIATKWKGMRKLYDQILQAKQKAYPGTSGWTYSDDLGFNVTDDTRDAWSNFVKAHLHFKPFATRGWPHFTTVDVIVPSRALGQYVFSPGTADPAAVPSQPSQEPSQPSQGDENDEDGSQPFSDWSQSNFGESQSPDPTNSVPVSQSTVSRAPASIHSCTLSTGSKRSAPDDIEPPHSVDGIGKVISAIFALPPKFSAMSPTKKVETARKLALEDMHGGYIMSDERTRLNILFGRDTSAADAYISDGDPFLRAETGRELLNQLNPMPNFNFH
ncbi:hypothetical protein B0H17DRAFT_1200279 [Mycena rosella]|uniref:Myb/SANT-like domain-containing protein n=1 Tax=Mycena rosella TaxID=1033263 RepID=A0AAD7DJH3_MYCRO|nr:hypothetical protein B0H17DRAFT_1200279 [Mycena rosella]